MVRAADRIRLFMAKVEVQPDGCWTWRGAMTPNGYGKFNMGDHSPVGNRIPDGAHRAAYRLFVGPIPDGLEIDHLCRNPRCVNPAHLEAVDHPTNLLRGRGIAYSVVRTGRCRNGHERTEATTYRTPQGHIQCRICSRANDARRRLKQKAN